jgi:3-deoxy-D-manno-octulosonate 8-phosphate phosphatase (KDO 8-P phosphatase)
LRKLQRKLEADLRDIKLLIFDVDGVLTDNRMIFMSGHQEAKNFSAADGFAIRATTGKVLHYAVISARNFDITITRCQELGIDDVFQQWDKQGALADLMKKHNLKPSQVGCIGNDVPDIVVMERVGLAVCPADAEREVLEFAHYQTERKGGKGCCREVVNFLLDARGINLLQLYRDRLKNA